MGEVDNIKCLKQIGLPAPVPSIENEDRTVNESVELFVIPEVIQFN
jgi:hypothetical protein